MSDRSTLDRFRRGLEHPLARLLVGVAVGCFGAAAIVIGLVTAWRSDSPSAALLVGAGLVVVGWLVIDRDILELTLGAGGTNIGMKRKVADAVRKSEREQNPEAALKQLREDLEELTYPAWGSSEWRQGAEERWANDLRWRIRAGYFNFGKPSFQYTLTPSRDGNPAVILGWCTSWWGDFVIRCTVTREDGSASSDLVLSTQQMSTNSFGATYPTGGSLRTSDTFAGAPPLAPGRYLFDWRRVGSLEGEPYRHHPDSERLARDEVTLTTEQLGAEESVRLEHREVAWGADWP